MLKRIYRRRVAPSDVVSPELATFLCECSHDVGRQVGILVDRRGQIDHVVVGDAHRLSLPDDRRQRAARGRFRGLRLVHTHLGGEALTHDDLTDLALLRLDLVCAVGVLGGGRAGQVYMAHLLPEKDGAGSPYRLLPAAPAHALSVDFLSLIRSLEDEFARTVDRVAQTDAGLSRALLVHVDVGRRGQVSAGRLAELRELCRSANVKVLDVVVQRRPDADPRFLLGRGKLSDVILRAMQLGAEVLIFDPDLTAGQARSISDFTELKVLDRTMLILDIFAQRAQSRDGKLQVELAQLKYTLPRLVEKNTMMSRLTGGIGGRGPGETKLEINRRRARERIGRLEQQIEELSKRRHVRRDRRTRREVPIVAIVGYTNAGKSTLQNTLTCGTVLAMDKLFATLDPTSRRLRFPREREIVLTDTVGFIRDLPPDLVNAFRATLEELSEADLLVHVVDVADPGRHEQAQAVERILCDLGLADKPRLVVWNKVDRLSPEEVETLRQTERGPFPSGIPISAQDPQTLAPLLEAMEKVLWQEGHVPALPTSWA
jgi:GTP-binding protein HflX